MAGSVNKVILIGHLGADPDVRRNNAGDPIVNIRIATSETWRDKQTGDRKEKTEWHTVVIFNPNLAKVAESYLKKGMKVYIEGALQTRKWEKDGVDRYTTEVILSNFRGDLQMLDSKNESGGGSRRDDDRSSGSTKSSNNKSSGGSSGGGASRDLDDEIPF